MKLTLRQQRFVDAYDGDTKKAAKRAGISYGYARNLMTKSDILQMIRQREKTEVRPKNIASRQTRQQFWTAIMDDESRHIRDRLKASELLARSELDFKDRSDTEDPMASLKDFIKEIDGTSRGLPSERGHYQDN